MSALRRVLTAPGLVIVLWLAQAAAAWLLAGIIAAAASAAMQGYAWVDDGHLLAAVAELTSNQRAVGVAMVQVAITATVLGIVFWTVTYGGIIARLEGKKPASEVAAASIKHMPGIAAQTIYIYLVRGLVMTPLGLMAAKFPSLAFVTGLGVMALTIVAADVARVSVVLHDARAFHPKTTIMALRRAVTRPALLARAGLLAIAGIAIPAVLVYIVMADTAGSASIWLARGLSLVGLVVGLWRIAFVVDSLDEG